MLRTAWELVEDQAQAKGTSQVPPPHTPPTPPPPPPLHHTHTSPHQHQAQVYRVLLLRHREVQGLKVLLDPVRPAAVHLLAALAKQQHVAELGEHRVSAVGAGPAEGVYLTWLGLVLRAAAAAAETAVVFESLSNSIRDLDLDLASCLRRRHAYLGWWMTQTMVSPVSRSVARHLKAGKKIRRQRRRASRSSAWSAYSMLGTHTHAWYPRQGGVYTTRTHGKIGWSSGLMGGSASCPFELWPSGIWYVLSF